MTIKHVVSEKDYRYLIVVQCRHCINQERMMAIWQAVNKGMNHEISICIFRSQSTNACDTFLAV